MTLYVFDTDHLSLYGRNHASLIDRLQQQSIVLTTTAINIEEQVRGRLAQVSEAKDGENLANAYLWLSETVKLLSEFEVLQFTTEAQSIYRELKSQRVRVGTQDLTIDNLVRVASALPNRSHNPKTRWRSLRLRNRPSNLKLDRPSNLKHRSI